MNVTVLDSELVIDESLLDESAAEIRSQVHEYGRGDRQTFDLTVDFLDGFTGTVMGAMTAIPYGETRSYGDLATDLDTSPVAIGQACARNPVPIVVPCHRVVGSDGDLGGFSAAGGVTTKRRLLDLESRERGTGPVQSRFSTDW